MSDDSDTDFDMFPDRSAPTSAAKGKGKAGGTAQSNAAAKNKTASEFTMDFLLEESKEMVETKEKVIAGLDMEEVRQIMESDINTEIKKEEVRVGNAKAELAQYVMMKDESISIPGVIQVFQPTRVRNPGLAFDVPCPREDLAVLFDAFKQAARHAHDLEELLTGGLVPWIRKNQDGKAPPELCRWLMQLLATHESPFVVIAAEEALLGLVSDPNKVWRLRYEDTLHVWCKCGAPWLDESDSEDSRMDEEEVGEIEGSVRRNLGPFLNVVEACLRNGAHEFTDEQLTETLLSLCAAALDTEVCASCQSEVYRTLEAVVDSMSSGFYDNPGFFFTLVDRICDPYARKLTESRVEPLSFVLLARNIPFKPAFATQVRDGGTGEEGGSDVNGTTKFSLRHEVCHRLLSRRFLKNTSYAEDESVVGFSRTIKAIDVMLEGEDDIFEDVSPKGYERRYVVVALADEMSAGALAVTETGRPSVDDCKKLLRMVEDLNKQMRETMQTYVRKTKNLLDTMKTKLSPYAQKTVQQSTLSTFMEKAEGDEDSSTVNNDGDSEDGYETDPGIQSQSQ